MNPTTEQLRWHSAGYSAGYAEACNVLRGQMLGKMHFYRTMLADAALAISGNITASQHNYITQRIRSELALNPEWEVLEHMPHGTIMNQDPDMYKAINTGPEPKP